MKKINIGGVPEHFNAPWHYAIQNGLFNQEGIELNFIDYATGTGALCADCAKGKLDLAVVLTEGIIAFINQKSQLKILSPYVTTPLKWGIHVAKSSKLNSISDLCHKTFAISRKGSGSHLMAMVLARQQGWALSDIQFVVAGGIEALGSTVASGEAHVFMWETFTTKPHLTRFGLKCIAEFPTPWPCFCIAVNKTMEKQIAMEKKILSVIHHACDLFNKDHSLAIDFIAHHYQLPKVDINQWITQVTWATHVNVGATVINNVSENLLAADIIDQAKPSTELIAHPLT